jgi:hypothetical protein
MRSGSAGTHPGAVVGGRIVDPGAAGIVLKQLLARSEITETRALVAASDALATFRVLSFPATATDDAIDSAVSRELPLDPTKMATKWIELQRDTGSREVYAAAWDREQVKNVTEAARVAGLEATVVELKSVCLARTVSEPACVVVDILSNPMEALLIDGSVPQVWHSFRADGGDDDLANILAGPLRSVLKFYKRRPNMGFGSHSPILVSGEQTIPTDVAARLGELVDQPVRSLDMPPRVPAEIRHTTYLTCLGLLMRRTR